MPVEKQVLILYALTHGFLDPIPIEDIGRFQDEMFDFFDSNAADLLKQSRDTGNLPDTEKLDAQIKAFAGGFQTSKQLAAAKG